MNKNSLIVFFLIFTASLPADERDRKLLDAHRQEEAEKQLREDALGRLQAQHLIDLSRRQQDRMIIVLKDYLVAVQTLQASGKKQIHPILSGAILSEYYRLQVDTQPRLRDREANPDKLKSPRARYQVVNEIITLESLEFLAAYGRAMLEESAKESKLSVSDRRLSAMRMALLRQSPIARQHSIFFQQEALVVAASENGIQLGKKLEFLYRETNAMTVQEGLRLADTLSALVYQANQSRLPAWRRAFALTQK